MVERASVELIPTLRAVGFCCSRLHGSSAEVYSVTCPEEVDRGD